MRRPNQNSKTAIYKVCPKCGDKTLRKGSRAQSGKTRWVCRAGDGDRSYCYSTTNPDTPYRGRNKPKDHEVNPQFKRKLGGIKRFVITAAQNATPVHKGFLTALQSYCKHNNAELVVIPLRYKNVTSVWTESQENEERWAPELAPYLYNQRKKLNDNLVLLGDVKTQPTAARPLTSFESLTHGESCILGHTKLQLMTVPTPQGKLPKIMTTTGAVTLPNYTDSKAGKIGEFHHAQAAVAVDIVGKKFFLYQLNADKTGGFQHLTKYYYPDKRGILKGAGVAAIAFGDTHRKFIDKGVEDATFGKGGIVDMLKPEHLVFHDLHDGYAENPHHRGNPFIALAKQMSGFNSVAEEVRGDIKWLQKVCAKRKGVIVSSNHDNFLSRWIRDSDWRWDPTNAEFYLETALHMAQQTSMGESGAETPDPFTYWVEKGLAAKDNIRCLQADESFIVGGVEMGLHGDKGPNGSRGSRMNLRKIGVKTVIGHAHSPGIEGGCYQCGTSTPLRLEYTGGPSSWMHAHCVVYPSGKRSLLFVIDGSWKF